MSRLPVILGFDGDSEEKLIAAVSGIDPQRFSFVSTEQSRRRIFGGPSTPSIILDSDYRRPMQLYLKGDTAFVEQPDGILVVPFDEPHRLLDIEKELYSIEGGSEFVSVLTTIPTPLLTIIVPPYTIIAQFSFPTAGDEVDLFQGTIGDMLVIGIDRSLIGLRLHTE